MNKLIELSQLDAQAHWPEAEAYLSQAVHNDHSEVQLRVTKGRVFAGLDTLWKLEGEESQTLGWATTFIYTADGITVVAQIQVAAGTDLAAILDKLNEFENWAHSKGAHYIEVVGRRGWVKPLRALGFEHNYTSLVKEVYQELH